MKKQIIIFTLSFLFMTLCVLNVSADAFENPVYTQEFIAQQEAMLANVNQLFPRFLFQETFDVATKPAISKPEDGYYRYEMIRSGRYESMLATYKTVVKNQGWGETYFNTTGSYEDFYMAIDVQVLEKDDSGKGFVWFQYTNGDLVGAASRDAVEIEFPLSVQSYVTNSGDRVYTTRYELRDYKNDYDVHRLEVMRLDGYARIFIDGHFITGFEDGFSGKFYQLYGPE